MRIHLVLSVIVVIYCVASSFGVTSKMDLLGDSVQPFIAEGTVFELRRSSELLPASDKSSPQEKLTYSLVVKSEGEQIQETIVWSKTDYRPLPEEEDIIVYDVARSGNEVFILHADLRKVYLDIVRLAGEQKAAHSTSIPILRRSSGVGPPVTAGRLLATRLGVNALFNLGGGILELWAVVEGEPKLLWTQWQGTPTALDRPVDSN
jgi:hypothetical protein